MNKFGFFAIILLMMASCAVQKNRNVEFDSNITEKYWRMKTLNGKPVDMKQAQEREIYFILKNNGSVKGFGGCNQFKGTFELKAKNKIKLGNISTTLKSCPGIEDKNFLNVLNSSNSFIFNNDKLQLLQSGKVLATFEAIYF